MFSVILRGNTLFLFGPKLTCTCRINVKFFLDNIRSVLNGFFEPKTSRGNLQPVSKMRTALRLKPSFTCSKQNC